MHRAAPQPQYHNRQPTGYGEILLRTLLANFVLFLVAMFVKNNIQYESIAVFALVVYPVIVFFESIWVHGLGEKYVFFFLSFVILLLVSLFTTFHSAGWLPRFSFPEIVTQWHFYIYFPIIAPYLSHKLSALLFKAD